MECRKNELPGASRKTTRQRRKTPPARHWGTGPFPYAAGGLRTRRAFRRGFRSVGLAEAAPRPPGLGGGGEPFFGKSRPVPVRAFPRIAGNRSGCGWLPQPSGACRFVMARQRPRFSEESLIQRSSRRTASPSIKRPAEGREAPGWTPPTAFPLKSAAIRGRSQGRRRRLQRPCCRPWCPHVRWPARCCP